MGLHRMANFIFFALVVLLLPTVFNDRVMALPANKTALRHSRIINKEGSYMGIMMADQSELDPLLVPSIFTPHPSIPVIDLAGRRFHIGVVCGHKVIAVRSGDGMQNAVMTTQALLDFFRIKGIVHYGTAGCINSSMSIGFVMIPKQLAHVGVWTWQRLGEGPNISHGYQGINDSGNLHFGDYDIPKGSRENLLNNVLIRPEEVYSVKGVPEVAQYVFWVTVNEQFFKVASKLQGVELESCVNATTCLDSKPKVVVGLKAASASVFVDNAAYRDFLYNRYGVSSIDEESTGIALDVCACFTIQCREPIQGHVETEMEELDAVARNPVCFHMKPEAVVAYRRHVGSGVGPTLHRLPGRAQVPAVGDWWWAWCGSHWEDMAITWQLVIGDQDDMWWGVTHGGECSTLWVPPSFSFVCCRTCGVSWLELPEGHPFGFVRV